ncbi:CorA metal ion transporter [Geranomyces variabilis]|uniref:CorA metal ion transporter n=1 Tax=Geranomyces variabilis TaxID=109894 RepID=A0AAD5TC30_9FUNG|nr:CorA metal ion transporter [Geranomyces variabilis]
MASRRESVVGASETVPQPPPPPTETTALLAKQGGFRRHSMFPTSSSPTNARLQNHAVVIPIPADNTAQSLARARRSSLSSPNFLATAGRRGEVRTPPVPSVRDREEYLPPVFLSSLRHSSARGSRVRLSAGSSSGGPGMVSGKARSYSALAGPRLSSDVRPRAASGGHQQRRQRVHRHRHHATPFGIASDYSAMSGGRSGSQVPPPHRRHVSQPDYPSRQSSGRDSAPSRFASSSSSSSSSSSASSVFGFGSSRQDDYWKDSDTDSLSSSDENEYKGVEWLLRQKRGGSESDEESAISPPGGAQSGDTQYTSPAHAAAGGVAGPQHFDSGEENSVDSANEPYIDFTLLEQTFLESHETYLTSSTLLFEGDAYTNRNFNSPSDPHYRDLAQPQCTFYSPGVGVVRAKRFQDFAGDDGQWLRRQAEEGNFWIDIHRPSEDELALIAKVFGIHALTLEDMIDADIQREKCDAFNEYVSLAVRTIDIYEPAGATPPAPGVAPTTRGPTTMWILVYPSCIITFHVQPLVQIPKTMQRLSRIHSVTEKKSKHPHTFFHTAWVCYLLIDEVLEMLQPLIHHIDDESDQIENLVLYGWEDDEEASKGTEMLQRMHAARKQNTVLLRLLGDKVGVLRSVVKKGVVKGGGGGLGGGGRWKGGAELGLYFESLQDRAMADILRLKHFEEMLTRSHSEYLEEISLCLNAASKKGGGIARNLTAVITLLVPLGALTGTMGVNVRVPGQPDEDDDDRDLTNFFLASLLMLGIFAGGYVLARRWSWFSDAAAAHQRDAAYSGAATATTTTQPQPRRGEDAAIK